VRTAEKTISITVWDLPTRLFHWSLLLLIAACWWSSTEDGDIDWHLRCGYAVLALLLFRLGWGICGSTSARFASFVAAPRAVLAYLAGLRRHDNTPQVGHNPAGGWMVLALLGTVLAITATGLCANDDMMTEGPFAQLVGKELSDLLTGWHETGFYGLLALVGLHLAAILFYLLVKRENLVRPMLDGIKQLPAAIAPPQLRQASIRLALLVAAAAAGTAWLLANCV